MFIGSTYVVKLDKNGTNGCLICGKPNEFLPPKTNIPNEHLFPKVHPPLLPKFTPNVNKPQTKGNDYATKAPKFTLNPNRASPHGPLPKIGGKQPPLPPPPPLVSKRPSLKNHRGSPSEGEDCHHNNHPILNREGDRWTAKAPPPKPYVAKWEDPLPSPPPPLPPAWNQPAPVPKQPVWNQPAPAPPPPQQPIWNPPVPAELPQQPIWNPPVPTEPPQQPDWNPPAPTAPPIWEQPSPTSPPQKPIWNPIPPKAPPPVWEQPVKQPIWTNPPTWKLNRQIVESDKVKRLWTNNPPVQFKNVQWGVTKHNKVWKVTIRPQRPRSNNRLLKTTPCSKGQNRNLKQTEEPSVLLSYLINRNGVEMSSNDTSLNNKTLKVNNGNKGKISLIF